MDEVIINKTDEIVMKLLYYFITKEGYNPVVLHGAKDEIWLENLKGEYRIVRIVTNYIHNNEQLDYDLYRTKHIIKGIKKKTLSMQMNTLSIFLNLSNDIQIKEQIKNITCIKIKDAKELKKHELLLSYFPNINKEMDLKEKGLELFKKITKSIDEVNENNYKKADEIFKMKFPFITYLIIALNVIVFLLMYLIGNGSESADTLLKFGANHVELFRRGDYFRIITSGFLHIGIIHLFVNCYSLYVIGPKLESYYGKIKFVIIYLFSMIFGSLLSMVFHDGISAGASGAIFGLLGSFLYFGYHHRIYFGNALKSNIIPIIAINLIIGFSVSGIDNGAHIGGLIGGILTSMAVGVKYQSKKMDKINGIIMSTIFLGFLLYLVLFGK